MAFARYYVWTESPLPTKQLLFTASSAARPKWTWVVVRGTDRAGNELIPLGLHTQQGGGTLDWQDDCYYEFVFSDESIDQSVLRGLDAAGQPHFWDERAISFSPDKDHGGGIGVYYADDPPPPPPPPAVTTADHAPGVAFSMTNVCDIG